MITVTFYCSHNDDPDHERCVVWVTTAPVPEDWSPYSRSSELDLNCTYCRRSPRPGRERLRTLLNALAGMPGGEADAEVDISHWPL